MTDMTLLTHRFSAERGGFEAIVMVQTGSSKRRLDCFFAADETASDRTIIKGLLQDAKDQQSPASVSANTNGFPLSPNLVRFITT